MKDWKALARASGLKNSDEELERLVAPLEALETAFRPLVNDLTPEIEPITGISVPEDGQ